MYYLLAEASSAHLISFTAVMTGGQFVPGGENIVPFDEVISNPDKHYNVTTYKFKCPVENMYFFTFSLYSSGMYVTIRQDVNVMVCIVIFTS